MNGEQSYQDHNHDGEEGVALPVRLSIKELHDEIKSVEFYPVGHLKIFVCIVELKDGFKASGLSGGMEAEDYGTIEMNVPEEEIKQNAFEAAMMSVDLHNIDFGTN